MSSYRTVPISSTKAAHRSSRSVRNSDRESVFIVRARERDDDVYDAADNVLL